MALLSLWRKSLDRRDLWSEPSGEPGRNRTCDPRIKSALLYQLSYGPTFSITYDLCYTTHFLTALHNAPKKWTTSSYHQLKSAPSVGSYTTRIWRRT